MDKYDGIGIAIAGDVAAIDIDHCIENGVLSDMAEEIVSKVNTYTEIINRKHFVAAKYIDYLPDLISSPDYIGIHDSNIEMVKCYKDNIFISVKLDTKKSKYYVATVFDVKQSKIDSYVRNGKVICN